jgi:hypothetical protein
MRPIVSALVWALLVTGRAVAIDLDLTPQQIESALSIARGTDTVRTAFHEPYMRALNEPLVERIEVVSEFRRVVLMAEERARKGDRMFGYSASQAQKALEPWHHRVSVIARLRFHPQNTYVDVPPAEIVLDAPGADRARIGVLKEPIMSLPSLKPNDRLPVLGAVVEGVFDATQIHDGTRAFIVRLEGKDIARVNFDLGMLR